MEPASLQSEQQASIHLKAQTKGSVSYTSRANANRVVTNKAMRATEASIDHCFVTAKIYSFLVVLHAQLGLTPEEQSGPLKLLWSSGGGSSGSRLSVDYSLNTRMCPHTHIPTLLEPVLSVFMCYCNKAPNSCILFLS